MERQAYKYNDKFSANGKAAICELGREIVANLARLNRENPTVHHGVRWLAREISAQRGAPLSPNAVAKWISTGQITPANREFLRGVWRAYFDGVNKAKVRAIRGAPRSRTKSEFTMELQPDPVELAVLQVLIERMSPEDRLDAVRYMLDKLMQRRQEEAAHGNGQDQPDRKKA